MKKLSAIDWLLLLMAVLGILLVIMSNRAKQNVERIITTTDTIYITDTITQWQPYDVHHYRTDTTYLPVINTLLDTVTDSVFVEVPISIYQYDTTIVDTTHTTRIQADISGFNVSLEQLTATTKIMQQNPKKQPWYTNICPAVGVGFGTGGFGVFAGVGYRL